MPALLAATAAALKTPTTSPQITIKSQNIAKYRSYPANIVTDIMIPRKTTGIIAMRDWHMEGSKLYSLVTGSEWTGSIVESDKLPNANNNNGIYAFQLGRRGSYEGDVTGIVSLSGKCQVGQNEGIIRAQRCDILVLITNKNGRELSKRYGIPVFVTDEDSNYLEKWLISDEGIYWIKHNNELLRSMILKENDPFKQIEEILKREKF